MDRPPNIVVDRAYELVGRALAACCGRSLAAAASGAQAQSAIMIFICICFVRAPKSKPFVNTYTNDESVAHKAPDDFSAQKSLGTNALTRLKPLCKLERLLYCVCAQRATIARAKRAKR